MTALQTMRDLTTRTRGHTHQISVIIVDRSNLLVDSLQYTMECAGFNVETARSGEEAICKTEIKHFDLAIIDNNLLDLTGKELTLMLKEHTPGINVMILNGSTEAEEKVANNYNLKATDQGDLAKISRLIFDNR